MALGPRNDATRDINQSEFEHALGYALITHTEASGVNGGDFNSGAWRIRPLNTINENYCEVALAANVFTLLPGRYVIRACAVGAACSRHQVRLYDVTAGAALAPVGTVCYEFVSVQIGYTAHESEVEVRVRHVASNQFRLEHRCQTTALVNGMGIDSGWGDNVYAYVSIWKVDK